MSSRGGRQSASLASVVAPALLGGGGLAAFLPLIGQGVAAEFSTGRWVWPSRPLEALSGLLHGRPGSGFVTAQRVPSAASIYGWTAVLELAFLMVVGGVGWLLYSAATGRGTGYAGAGEARRAAGAGRLRAARRELRPDLVQASRWSRVQPHELGVRVGRRSTRRGLQLWSRADRTLGVIGPQGCGKSLDLLLPALMACPGAALVTLTKPQDLLLVLDERSRDGRPVLVLDPFELAPGLPQLVWDPVAGCVDPVIAARRAKAFAAGTIRGATARGAGDDAAKFYAAEAVKVLTAFFHAAALTGRNLQDVIGWVARPQSADEAVEILRRHALAEPFLDAQLASALFNDDPRTAGNTRTTVHQAMEPFLQSAFRQRFTPSDQRPATDIEEVLANGGTIFLLGREDPYSSATPLMTAVAEHVIDTARRMATASRWHRLAPWMLCVLDELPSTAPIPSLPISMANDRALGIGYLWASQTRRQLVEAYGRDAAESVIALTNSLVVFGGGKDPQFYDDIAQLAGDTRTPGSRRRDYDYMPVLQRGDLRRLPPGRALLLSEHTRPIEVRLDRCIDGPDGKRLLRAATKTAAGVEFARTGRVSAQDRAGEAVAWAADNSLTARRATRR